MTKSKRMTIQIMCAVFLCFSGLILMYISFFIKPQGVIDVSVLTASGEIFTFCGSLFGIDYHYKFKHATINKDSNV